jgi:RNA polymerase sigma-70 factor (ECF subfamily)
MMSKARDDVAAVHCEGDARLMAMVAADDPDARRALAQRLMARARRVTASLLRDGADRDDAVQLGLLEVFRSAGDYRGEGPVERWADRVVVRAAFRVARERRRTSAMIDPEVDIEAIAEPERAKAAPAGSSAEGVQKYLEELPEACRTVLVLRHVLGHSVGEIAELTGVSPNTVKDRLLRGREMFRRLVRRARVVESALPGGSS